MLAKEALHGKTMTLLYYFLVDRESNELARQDGLTCDMHGNVPLLLAASCTTKKDFCKR